MHKPKATVVVCTYQHANYIKQCLDSILMQITAFPFEIIIGEDESTDGTRKICKEYAEKYPQISLFLRSREDVISIDGRLTGRYNFVKSIESAKGKYIFYCDGDDYWTDSGKIAKQVNWLEQNPDFVLCYHNVTILSPTLTKKTGLELIEQRDLSKKEVISIHKIPIMSLCFRNIDINFPKLFYSTPNGDYFLYSILGFYGKGKYLNCIGSSIYRYHDDGVWSPLDDLSKSKKLFISLRNISIYVNRKDRLMGNELFEKYFIQTKILIRKYAWKKKYSKSIQILWYFLIDSISLKYYSYSYNLLIFIINSFLRKEKIN